VRGGVPSKRISRPMGFYWGHRETWGTVFAELDSDSKASQKRKVRRKADARRLVCTGETRGGIGITRTKTCRQERPEKSPEHGK